MLGREIRFSRPGRQICSAQDVPFWETHWADDVAVKGARTLSNVAENLDCARSLMTVRNLPIHH